MYIVAPLFPHVQLRHKSIFVLAQYIKYFCFGTKFVVDEHNRHYTNSVPKTHFCCEKKTTSFSSSSTGVVSDRPSSLLKKSAPPRKKKQKKNDRPVNAVYVYITYTRSFKTLF